MIYAQLPDATDPYTPHQVMLDVAYVGGMICLEIVDRTEDGSTVTSKRREGASISVDAWGLANIINGMVGADLNHGIRHKRGDLDNNFYNGYVSPFKGAHVAPTAVEESE
jgi:hypothetical protein